MDRSIQVCADKDLSIWTPGAAHYIETIAKHGKRGDKHMSKICETVEKYVMNSANFKHDILKNKSAKVKGETLNKCWDLLFKNTNSSAAIEFKSIKQSVFGKHFSSRVEEAIGVATDARLEQKNIWLGYLLVYDLDAQIPNKRHHKQIEKCTSFLKALKDKYSLYDSTHLISIDNEGQVRELYNSASGFLASLTTFIKS